MCCQRASSQSTERQPERDREKGREPELKLTAEDIPGGGDRSSPPARRSPAPALGLADGGMGCATAHHLACQPQIQTGAAGGHQDGQSLEGGPQGGGGGGGGPKVPEVLSSLERLSQATGGMEKSWYRCIFPFGIISLVIGVSGTGVTYAYNDLPQTKVVSVVLLVAGVVLVLTATACWTVHKKRKRKKKEGGGGGSFTSEQCPL